MSQNLPVRCFKFIENTTHFNVGLIKSCNEDSDEFS